MSANSNPTPRRATTETYRLPSRWFNVGKYLLPLGMNYPTWRRTRAPSEQVSVSRLATDYSNLVMLKTFGNAEVLTDYDFECFDHGRRSYCVLPTTFIPPAFVAQIRNGISYGRHCCVIGPEGKAVRETGYHLDGSVVEDGGSVSRLRARYWRKRWEGDVTSRFWLPPKQHVTGSVAVLNTRHSHNYYHWLCDILPRLVPLRWAGVRPDYYLVDCKTDFQRNVLAAFGIEAHCLIQPHCRLLLEADNLVVPSHPTPACIRQFGKLFTSERQVFVAGSTRRRIYISRRRTGKRTVAEEHELIRLLESHEFETHSMEEYSLAEQAQLIRESEVIVAPHGAGLANLIFARPGTHVIEIVPQGRYNASLYPEKSRILGLHHQQVIAKNIGRKQTLTFSLADVSEALGRIDQVRRRLAA
jgi:capsular polysaccharide biosynthesis protein